MTIRIWQTATIAILSMIVVLAASAGNAAAADRPWAPQVDAGYKIVVAGFELGKFDFASKFNGQSYVLAGTARLTWGFGMFSWTSTTRSAGTVAGDMVAPARYEFDYTKNSSPGSVKLTFAAGQVTTIDIRPPSDESGLVPVKDHHLKAVLDPMSALIANSRATAAHPCDRRVAVFDGKQRFDLVMTLVRQEKIVDAKPGGQPVTGYVCRVRYVPIAGHKPNKATQDLADHTGIEVLLRAVPSAHLLIAQRITIPTMVGRVEITLKHADIVDPANAHIALRH